MIFFKISNVKMCMFFLNSNSVCKICSFEVYYGDVAKKLNEWVRGQFGKICINYPQPVLLFFELHHHNIPQKNKFFIQNWNVKKDCIVLGPLALDTLLVPKISKSHFFQDIKNSFHGVTQIGLKPHQNFFQFFFQQIWLLEEFKVFTYQRALLTQ